MCSFYRQVSSLPTKDLNDSEATQFAVKDTTKDWADALEKKVTDEHTVQIANRVKKNRPEKFKLGKATIKEEMDTATLKSGKKKSRKKEYKESKVTTSS